MALDLLSSAAVASSWTAKKKLNMGRSSFNINNNNNNNNNNNKSKNNKKHTNRKNNTNNKNTNKTNKNSNNSASILSLPVSCQSGDGKRAKCFSIAKLGVSLVSLRTKGKGFGENQWAKFFGG